MFVFEERFSGIYIEFYSHKPSCERPEYKEYKVFGGYFEPAGKRIQHCPFRYSLASINSSITVWLSVI